MVLSSLEPKKVFEFFELLSSVPHGSGNTKAVSDICVDFAKQRGLEYYQDEFNNVIIYKPATPGYENADAVILQGHLDMVCAKEPDDPTDMAKVPITLAVDGDWVHAVGTSLGGDDGIAVAMALAILDSSDLMHPRLECVFTIDEETGMDGAVGLDCTHLTGRRMLNLDSEEEGVLTCGCSGGARVDCDIKTSREDADGYVRYFVKLGGLTGGHSGCDIDKGRGNANKLLARFLYTANEEIGLRLVHMAGGRFDNVITPEATAEIAVPAGSAAAFSALAKAYDGIYKNEYSAADKGVFLTAEKIDGDCAPLTAEDTARVLLCLLLLPQGVIEMSMDIKGLVQTSLNLGILRLEDGDFHCSFSVRSSILTQKEMLITRLKATLEAVGGTVSVRSAYPGWQFAKVSPIRDTVSEVFAEVYGKPAEITATHGGLECGLFIEKLPGLDAVSFGPDLRDIHSVRERMSVASVQRMYKALVKILEKCR